MHTWNRSGYELFHKFPEFCIMRSRVRAPSNLTTSPQRNNHTIECGKPQKNCSYKCGRNDVVRKFSKCKTCSFWQIIWKGEESWGDKYSKIRNPDTPTVAVLRKHVEAKRNWACCWSLKSTHGSKWCSILSRWANVVRKGSMAHGPFSPSGNGPHRSATVLWSAVFRWFEQYYFQLYECDLSVSSCVSYSVDMFCLMSCEQTVESSVTLQALLQIPNTSLGSKIPLEICPMGSCKGCVQSREGIFWQ